MNYINGLLESGMNTVIDISIDNVIMDDEIYRTDIKDSEDIYNRLIDTLSEEEKNY